MCGRYARFTPQHLYSQLFCAADMGTLSPHYNIAPSQAVLVARKSEWGDDRQLTTLYWGLVAPWAKAWQAARKRINARAEAAHERPMFRNALARRRCFVAGNVFHKRSAP
jgi:putative SOS response-associated peptidase YedK